MAAAYSAELLSGEHLGFEWDCGKKGRDKETRRVNLENWRISSEYVLFAPDVSGPASYVDEVERKDAGEGFEERFAVTLEAYPYCVTYHILPTTHG